MTSTRILLPIVALVISESSSFAIDVDPSSNPLMGSWVLTEAGYGACHSQQTFSRHSQTWVVGGQTVTADATYAVSGDTI